MSRGSDPCEGPPKPVRCYQGGKIKAIALKGLVNEDVDYEKKHCGINEDEDQPVGDQVATSGLNCFATGPDYRDLTTIVNEEVAYLASLVRRFRADDLSDQVVIVAVRDADLDDLANIGLAIVDQNDTIDIGRLL